MTHENVCLAKALASVAGRSLVAEQGIRTGNPRKLSGNSPHPIRDLGAPEQGTAFVILLAGIAGPPCTPRRARTRTRVAASGPLEVDTLALMHGKGPASAARWVASAPAITIMSRGSIDAWPAWPSSHRTSRQAGTPKRSARATASLCNLMHALRIRSDRRVPASSRARSEYNAPLFLRSVRPLRSEPFESRAWTDRKRPQASPAAVGQPVLRSRASLASVTSRAATFRCRNEDTVRHLPGRRSRSCPLACAEFRDRAIATPLGPAAGPAGLAYACRHARVPSGVAD